MRLLTAGAVVLLIAMGTAGAQPPPPGYGQPPPPGYGQPPPPGYGQPPRPGYAPIPPPRVEVVPPPPRPTAVWQPGHWHWNGYRYIWINGQYVERRPQYGRYIPGGWVWRHNHWVWIPAHWG